ncbi:MAG: NAD-dependent epimerase/dehydratase family protein [Alphaproteobacteria bacterium]|nr:NAD-dependent epimerase/dehydratase family protein [Alphaproteobacteria bacterium]
MYVVLGGRGAVGRLVCDTLEAGKLPYAAPSSQEADARDANGLIRVCEGADAIICCVGLPYRAKVWRREWPRVAKALVTAAERTGARLVFLDNVYMYGPAPLTVPITEDHPQSPPSQKGRARQHAASLLLKAHESGRIAVTVARAADFYGPGAVDSVLWASFLERMIAAKPPRLLMTASARHTFAYTPDIARALVKLATDPGAAGRVWHLPVGQASTHASWVARFNHLLGTSLSASYLPACASRMLSLFSPLVREAHEMRYQFDSDYVLSDHDFRARYPDFQTTPYDEGAARVIAWAKARAPEAPPTPRPSASRHTVPGGDR